MRLRLLCSLALPIVALGLFIVPTTADEKKEPPKMLKEGDPAPAIELAATQIDKVLPDKKGAKAMSLKDFQGEKGKNVVLFFFPKALTGG